MLSTAKDSVGLKASIDLQGGKVIAGMRPTMAQAREWLAELQRELASVQTDLTKRRPGAIVARR